jgi:hypothetical protein
MLMTTHYRFSATLCGASRKPRFRFRLHDVRKPRQESAPQEVAESLEWAYLSVFWPLDWLRYCPPQR